MTNDVDILSILESEAEAGFGDEFNYKQDKKGPKTFEPNFQVKVWNPSPKEKTTNDTPRLIVRKSFKEGDNWVREDSDIASIEATILYVSFYREVSGKDRSGKFGIRCSSHDGTVPSKSIDNPLCRDIKAADIADRFAGWSGYDQTKVNAKVEEVTHGTPCLQVCGLKKADGGSIPLCRYATKDAPASKQCKEMMKVFCYDHTNKRNFTMSLSGASIRSFKYLAPIHTFLAHCRNVAKVAIPYYLFRVTLAPIKNGNADGFYLLDVKNYQPITNPDERSAMKELAHKAKDAWVRASQRLSKEEFEKQKAQQADNISKEEEKKTLNKPKVQEEVSFEDDDIDF